MSVTTLHDPSHREALWELESAFERGDLITVFGRCTVDYEGRAATELGPGDRLLVLKPDGAALVHTDEGRTPVNWQPPGSEHHAAVRDGRLRVRSERTSPDETLTVRFSAVHQLSAMAVTGGRDLEVHGSEADLRTRILERPALVEEGFDPRETERESSAGPMDVFGVDADGRPVVVELKRRRVGPSAVSQLGRYVDAVREELGDDPEVRGVLVAPSVTDRAADLLDDRGFGHVALDPSPTGDAVANDGSSEGDAAANDGSSEGDAVANDGSSEGDAVANDGSPEGDAVANDGSPEGDAVANDGSPEGDADDADPDSTPEDRASSRAGE